MVQEGQFLPLKATFGHAMLRRLEHDALKAEIGRQLEAFRNAFGRAPDFIDGHQHLHLFPQIGRALLEVAKESAPDAWLRQCGRVVPFGSELEPLERRINYRFKARGMLEHALTHRSRVHEDASGGVFDNESMEFLGDSVLGFVIAAMLFREFPQHNEGQKSKLKASIVSATSLARLGEAINLGEFLILGRGEEKTGGRRKHALIADCYEALIAAIFLDGGIEPARAFIERQFAALIEDARRTGAHAAFTEDYKSALQEWLQSHDRGLPAYRLAAEVGPAHRRMFDVEVVVNGLPIARAEGKSKKEAAQAAAKLALERLATEE